MRSHLRAGVVSVAAILAIAIVLAQPASATMLSNPSGTNASFVSTGNMVLTIGASVYACASWTVTATISGSSASAAASGTAWSDCTFTLLGLSGAWTPNDSSAWTFAITTSLGGGSYSVSMTNGNFGMAVAGCSLTFATSTYSGLTWTNATKSLVVALTGVKYTASGVVCPLPGAGSDAALSVTFSEPTLTVS